jgi:hypothetical protein
MRLPYHRRFRILAGDVSIDVAAHQTLQRSVRNLPKREGLRFTVEIAA